MTRPDDADLVRDPDSSDAGSDAAEPAGSVDSRRRDLLRGLAAVPIVGVGAGLSPAGSAASATVSPGVGGEVVRQPGRGEHVAVIGAGVFGGWTALYLARAGARVTLIDAWGPGNSRASSGGESRVIRHAYGADRVYTEWVVRAKELWLEHQERWGRELYRETGVLFLAQGDDLIAREALPILRDLEVEHERLDPDEVGRRWPQIAPDGIRWALWEPAAGYLLARDNCARVLEACIEEGVEYLEAHARPGDVTAGELRGLHVEPGGELTADRYVFACGPWLGRLFPDVLGDRIRPTRQEVFYFGVAAGDDRYREGHLPVWADLGERLWYGIPGSGNRGFKVADDTLGPPFDPTSGERRPSAEGLARAREYAASRFPGLRDAPLLEARVCQYENSPDSHFIIDRHPGAENVWLVGGGSGHGYKHGPALGEHVAGVVLEAAVPEPLFSLSRFADESGGSR